MHSLLVLGGTSFTAKDLQSREPRLSPRTSWSRRISSPKIKLYGIDQASMLWDSYNAALETNPLVVKSVTAGVILGAADFAGQALENRLRREEKDIDYARAARFAIFGLVLQGKRTDVSGSSFTTPRSSLEPFLLSDARRPDSTDSRTIFWDKRSKGVHRSVHPSAYFHSSHLCFSGDVRRQKCR
jgi:hypothetical protein